MITRLQSVSLHGIAMVRVPVSARVVGFVLYLLPPEAWVMSVGSGDRYS